MSERPFFTGRQVPSKAERRAYLRERGWAGIGESWRHPRFGSSYFFSLAAAYRTERGYEEKSA